MSRSLGRSVSLVRIVIVGVLVAAALLGARQAGLFDLHDRARLAGAIDRARALPYLEAAFVTTYAIGAAVGVPATPFTLAGGALFGVGWGIALNWIGEVLAALLAFGLTRATGLRSPARPTLADETATRLARGRGARTLFRLRLVPVVPFALLNAGAAVSGMTWRDFTIATAAGILPITVIYTISASELVAGVEGSGARALMLALVSAVVLIGVSFIPAMLRALGRRTP